jgi:hypothetical protein
VLLPSPGAPARSHEVGRSADASRQGWTQHAGPRCGRATLEPPLTGRFATYREVARPTDSVRLHMNAERFKKIAPAVRSWGFKGSPPTFRRVQDRLISLINFQTSRSGGSFFVNLGAQPTFIPIEGRIGPGEHDGLPNAARLKEYECVFRARVGSEWAWPRTYFGTAWLLRSVRKAQEEFVARFHRLPTAVASQPAEVLIRDFPVHDATTPERACLHLARICLALGQRDKAVALAQHGQQLVGTGAPLLVAELDALIRDAT